MRPIRIVVRALATGAILAAVLAVAGCGSSPKPLTRAELTRKADVICGKVTAKLEAINRDEKASTPQAFERLAAKLSGFEQGSLAELVKLVPPTELETDWKRFVAGAETLAENTGRVGAYVSGKDTSALKSLIISSSATQRQMAAIAKRDGMKNCEQVI